MIKDLQTKLGHERLASDEASAQTEADRTAIEQVLRSVRSELATEKLGHERAEQALCDALSTITDLTKKLHDAEQALTAAKAKLAAECQQAQESISKRMAAPPTDAPLVGDEPVPMVRGLRGRSRGQAVVQTPQRSIKADGRRAEPFRRAGKKAVKVADPKERKSRPVRWWLGER
jgi:hypothetical protein